MQWLNNILSNYLRFGTSIVVMIIMTPYIISEIGTTQYALWVMLLSALAIVNLTDLGFATAAVKFLAEPEGRGDIARRNEVAGLMQGVYAIVAVLCLSVTTVLVYSTDIVPARFGLQSLLMMLGVTTAIILLLTVHRAALIASGRQTTVNILTILGTLVQAGATYWLLEHGYGLEGVVFANIAGTLLPCIACVPLARLQLTEFDPSFSRESVSDLSRILPFTAHAFMANLAFLLVFRIDPFLIESWLDLEAVAIFAVAIKIAEQTLLLNKQFSNALMPLVSQLHGRNTHEDNALLFTAATRYLTALSFPLLAIVAMFAEPILMIWVGPEFKSATTVLQLLSLGILFSSIQLNAANYLGMTGHSAYVARTVLVAATGKIVISVALLPVVGIHACAIGLLISTLLLEFIPMTLAACRHADTSFAAFAGKSILPAAIATTPAFVVGSLMPPPSNLHELFGAALLCGIASLATFVAVCTRRQEWRDVARLVRPLNQRVEVI
jgi:O-antigen/teichoic acid export membrane protein